MDYKELIERLRKENQSWAAYHDQGLSHALEDAVDAIETLLAERDAAVENLSKKPHPSSCKYGEHCDYISAITGFPDCYSCDEWEWRGPQ